MKILLLQNQKGGVGKTTLAYHISAGLAAMGRNVMLVDADAQGSATIRAGQKKDGGLFKMLVDDEEWGDCTVRVAADRYMVEGYDPGNFYLMPSDKKTRAIASLIDDPGAFGRRCAELEDTGGVDVMVIDTSPTPSLLHGILYTPSDYLLIPTTPEFLSFDGLIESILNKQGADKARAERYALPPIEVLGIVPTMFRRGTLEHEDNLKALERRYGTAIWEPIGLSTVWPEADRSGKPVFLHAPKSYAASAAWNVIKKVEKVV